MYWRDKRLRMETRGVGKESVVRNRSLLTSLWGGGRETDGIFGIVRKRSRHIFIRVVIITIVVVVITILITMFIVFKNFLLLLLSICTIFITEFICFRSISSSRPRRKVMHDE